MTGHSIYPNNAIDTVHGVEEVSQISVGVSKDASWESSKDVSDWRFSVTYMSML